MSGNEQANSGKCSKVMRPFLSVFQPFLGELLLFSQLVFVVIYTRQKPVASGYTGSAIHLNQPPID